MSLTFLPRSAWNARPPTNRTRLVAGELHGVALHYPGMGKRHLFAQTDVARALRGWQDYHMDDRGWSDIAYQAAVDQAGRVWTLRDLLTRSGANGDAAANREYGALLLVLGDDEAPTGAMITSTRQVIGRFRALFPKATAIKPHSAVRPNPTTCPGNRVRALITAGEFNPRSTPTPPTEDKMNDADRDYVDGRMQAYSLWLNLRRLEDDLKVATAKKDTVAAGVLSPLAVQAKKDWEAAQA